MLKGVIEFTGEDMNLTEAFGRSISIPIAKVKIRSPKFGKIVEFESEFGVSETLKWSCLLGNDLWEKNPNFTDCIYNTNSCGRSYLVTGVQSVDKADAMVIGRQGPTDLNARNFQVLAGPFDSNRLNGLQTGATVETAENIQTAQVINVLPSIGNLSDGNGDVNAITRSVAKMSCVTDHGRLRSATSIDRHVSEAGQRDRFHS